MTEKSVKNRKSVFEINLKPYQKKEAYIHIKSDGEVVMLPLNLYPQNQFYELSYKEQIFFGFFYGILVLACIIYLFFFIALKDKAFVHYGFYVLFIALMQFSLDGFFHEYFTPEGGWLSDRAVLLTAFISLFFFGRYGDTFLNLKTNAYFLHIAGNILSMAVALGFLVLVFVPTSLTLSYPLANFIGVMVLAHMVTCLVIMKGKNIKIDPYFIMGIVFLVVGFVVFILNNFNIIDNSFFTNNGAKFGIGLEIIFLSISMSNRIRDLRMENEQNQLLALQRAEDMNEIKSSFLSNISHELRTPLNLIMGVASSLQQNKDEENLQEKCKLILNSSENLLGYIEDILDFTVIEKGDQELRETSFNLVTSLERIINTQKKKAEAKDLKFSVVGFEALPKRIIGDKGKLAQILNHLLDNAIKFTNQGGIEILLGCKRKGRKNMVFDITIKDTGIGISEEKMSTIFESFTKKSFRDRREFSGLGLGLFIVKNFVELQGGTITLKNNSTKGVTCNVSLSYKVEEEAELPKQELVPVNGMFALEGRTILLAEDNRMNQTVVKLLFKKWNNLNLIIANNGKEALEQLEKQKVDLILMDLQMPEMDGFEATSKIRGGRANCPMEIPIIVVSADNTSKTRKEIFRLGADDFVTKPINGELLLSKMNKYLSAKASFVA
ncbi:response regulator [Maribacter litopenaei]|uniref:histidine kinase n=1 Tax=Maribacter litopenaei TaxID=2976127 RepID=A0ABY5Y9S9_9FLAO|nr:7TM diverse intracellular signaling domain-containing protein [Maribacter litopenaei]UWX54890.1 response regulator [Maribacter litopenaei]